MKKCKYEIKKLIWEQMKIYDEYHHKTNLKFTDEFNNNYFDPVVDKILKLISEKITDFLNKNN